MDLDFSLCTMSELYKFNDIILKRDIMPGNLDCMCVDTEIRKKDKQEASV